MTWCTDCSNDAMAIVKKSSPSPPTTTDHTTCSDSPKYNRIKACPSCGHLIKWHEKGGIHNLPGLPAGVKFDPSDQELLQHLEAKMMRSSSSSSDSTDHDNNNGLHPLIDEFIPTLEGENGICYAHPENLPGVSKDGFIRHFFHRPSKAYTTGTRKRRKVHADIDGNETRWHKTGKTRAVFVDQGRDVIKGYKKILVLYTNYGKQRKPEKTNWVMHQYHLGNNDDEKDGELVVSKIFYQTQPRQCSSSTVLPKNSHCSEAKTNDSSAINTNVHSHGGGHRLKNNTTTMFGDYYNQSLISFKQTT